MERDQRRISVAAGTGWLSTMVNHKCQWRRDGRRDGRSRRRDTSLEQRPRQQDQYDFSADIEIKTIPLPTAGNIGRFSKTDSLYLEGTNNLDERSVQMALWGGGVSVADRANAYQMRSQDGRMQTRVGDGEWQTSNDATIAFAPEGDFLAFLDMAKNVALSSNHPATSADSHFTIYTFDLDGRAYAEKLTNITQKQLVSSGQLPVGTAPTASRTSGKDYRNGRTVGE